jgi:hypothetical protein
MIKKATAILACAVIVLAASLASTAPCLAADPGTWPSVPGFDKEDFVKIAETGFGDPMNNYAFPMTRFQGDVYVGTNRNFLCQILEVLQDAGVIPPGYEFTHVTCPARDSWSHERAQDMCGEIWRYRNSEWKLVYRSEPVFLPGYLGLPGLPPEGGWVAREPGFRSMVTFIDKWDEPAIYAASGISLIPGRLLLKSTDGITWDPVVTPLAMGSDSRSLAVHNGKLYVGPNIYMAIASIWATDDPSTTAVMAATGRWWLTSLRRGRGQM